MRIYAKRIICGTASQHKSLILHDGWTRVPDVNLFLVLLQKKHHAFYRSITRYGGIMAASAFFMITHFFQDCQNCKFARIAILGQGWRGSWFQIFSQSCPVPKQSHSLAVTVVSYQNESFSSKWELPCLPPSSLELWRRERASRQLSFWWKTLILIGHYGKW